jgi:GWxTD domain-containing protein
LFVKEFWQRRNPDPDSQDNPFEEEHYRRMAYSNEHFSTNGSGWQTDSGRIYITRGQPDQIQPDAAGDAGLAPGSETWKYRYVEGIGENVEVDFIDHRLIGDEPVTRNFDVFTSGVDGSELSASDCAYREWLDEDVLYSIGPDSVPTLSKFHEIEAIGASHTVVHGVNFDFDLDYVPVTHFMTLVPVRIKVPESGLDENTAESEQSPQLSLVCQITDARGYVVDIFEEPIPTSLETKTGALRYDSGVLTVQKSFPLRPGLYELTIFIRDAKSGEIGSITKDLIVPSMASQE